MGIVLTRTDLSNNPTLPPKMLGMSLNQFNKLCLEFEQVCIRCKAEAKYTIRGRKQRCRRVGGGRRQTSDLSTRLILYLFWLRARPTQKVLSDMYGLTRGSIVAILSDIRLAFEAFPSAGFVAYPKDHGRLRSLDQVVEAFPELALKSEEAQFMQ